MVNFALEPDPFEPVEMNAEYGDDWMKKKDEGKFSLSEFRPAPIIHKSSSNTTVYCKAFEDSPQQERERPHAIKQNEKPTFFTCETYSSYDDTASTLSMSVTSDENTKSTDKGSKDIVLQPAQGNESENIYYNEPEQQTNGDSSLFYGSRVVHKTEDLRPQTNRSSSPFYEKWAVRSTEKFRQDTPRNTSRVYDRLAMRETKSASLYRNSTRSKNSQDKAELTVKRLALPRDSSPLHDRLASQHTYASESWLSHRAPEPKKTIHFHTVVKSDSFNGTEVGSPRGQSPLRERLANRRTLSSRSKSSQGKAELTVKRLPLSRDSSPLSRDSSPLHDRLASHHTYASESWLSHRAPAPKNTIHFHTVVKSDSFNGTEVGSISMLPNEGPPPRPRRSIPPRGQSPLHERLANHHTLSSIQKQKQPGLQSSIRVRHASPKPFYTVTGSSNSITDDVSALTKPSFNPSPPRNSSRFRTVPVPPSPRYSTNRESTRARPGVPRNPSQRKKSTTRGQVRVNKDKQDALYHRLSRQDTVASSRMKPIPLHGKLRSPYEKMRRAEAEAEKTRRPKGPKNEEVYSRLISRGTKASIRKQMLNANPRYNSEHETFSEGCKHALMRNFKGSTFVRV